VFSIPDFTYYMKILFCQQSSTERFNLDTVLEIVADNPTDVPLHERGCAILLPTCEYVSFYF
jgi:hypothetical protein